MATHACPAVEEEALGKAAARGFETGSVLCDAALLRALLAGMSWCPVLLRTVNCCGVRAVALACEAEIRELSFVLVTAEVPPGVLALTINGRGGSWAEGLRRERGWTRRSEAHVANHSKKAAPSRALSAKLRSVLELVKHSKSACQQTFPVLTGTFARGGG